MKFCDTIILFASSCDNLAQVFHVLHNGRNLEPTPITLQMHETYKNANDHKRTKNNTSSTKKKYPLLNITFVTKVETI